MQFLTALLLSAATVQAHYTFPKMVINGQVESKEWTYVRKTANANGNDPITSVGGENFRCNARPGNGPTANIATGDKVGFTTSQQMNHPGPVQFYLAKVPSGQTAATWDGSGKVWFKVYNSLPTVTKDKQLTWPEQNTYKTPTFTVPKALPDGEYLLRVEQIALHQAAQAGGAQFYVACAQIKVSGGGSGTPGPLVAFPGAYSASDPGIKINLNTQPPPSTYTPPGPAVWSG